MADEPDSLENLLNKATNPINREEDWESILAFCDQINKELEGPQIAVRLLAHKIQSPQEKESLLTLSTLESCVKNCGKRFHQEIGKFRFLNEIIKVVSPKYLGNHTTEKVKKKCIELLYSWSEGLSSEPKVAEAYQMLKKQGIIKQDPVYIDKTLDAKPDRPKNAVFEDDEKSKLLARLLKSKHPEDLQAANRLIKNMVKQDSDRMEKVSKRVQQIETVNNNIKVLKEMLQHYRPGSASDAEKDLMKELYENLEKARPQLFRLASDTDEKDNEAIDEILRTNDEVLEMMNKYKNVVGGQDTSGPTTPENSSAGLIDMDGANKSSEPSVMSQLNSNDLDMLNDIFASSTAPSSADDFVQATPDIGMLSISGPASAPATGQAPLLPQPIPGPNAASPINWNQTNASSSTANSLFAGSKPNTVPNSTMSSGLLSGGTQPSVLSSNTAPAQSEKKVTEKSSSGFGTLEDLGKDLFQQSLSSVPAANLITTAPSTQSMTLNQMASIPLNHSSGVVNHTSPLVGSTLASSPIPTPPNSVTASPLRVSPQTPAKSVEVRPLTDVSVALESIQPGTHPPVSAYEKNNLKVVIHIGKDRPREDVMVMVLSVMSTHSSPVKSFSFQAAVPKIMKVKLQPPSATDLPASNPILPPTAITQVMLVANPSREKIRLKFKMSYTVNDQPVTEVGEIDSFPEK